MAREISNSEDVIDSRDIEARIDELESLRGDLDDEISELEDKLIELQAVESEEAEDERDELNEKIAEKRDELAELEEELKPLQEFRDQVSHPDWPHGLTLVHEDYWENFAREEAESLYGSELREAVWPFTCIDWERAAEELQSDYSQAEFDGVTFYFRS